MGLESVTHINDLDIANPVGATDPKSAGDNHIRNIKVALKNDFPDVDAPTASFFVGATAPASPVAGTRWWDTTAGLLKRRNAANNAWITSAESATTSNTVDIDGGTIDGTTIENSPIGAGTPSTIQATTLHTTGAITTDNTIDGRDVAADGTKLDGIEASATADQTGAEIKTAYEAEADTNAFTDAEKTKLSTAVPIFITSLTASNSPTLDFDSAVNFSTYDFYIFELIDIVPASNNQDLYIRTSSDGGSTYDQAAGSYVITGGSNSTRMIISSDGTNGWSNAAGDSISGEIKLWNPSNTSRNTHFTWHLTGADNSGLMADNKGSGRRNEANSVNGVRFLMAGGNIASGTIKVYGMN